jgi:hypothetical protein
MNQTTKFAGNPYSYPSMPSFYQSNTFSSISILNIDIYNKYPYTSSPVAPNVQTGFPQMYLILN